MDIKLRKGTDTVTIAGCSVFWAVEMSTAHGPKLQKDSIDLYTFQSQIIFCFADLH